MKQESLPRDLTKWQDITAACTTSVFTLANSKIMYKNGLVSIRLGGQTSTPSEEYATILTLPNNLTFIDSIVMGSATNREIYYLSPNGRNLRFRHSNTNLGAAALTCIIAVNET